MKTKSISPKSNEAYSEVFGEALASLNMVDDDHVPSLTLWAEA